MREGRRIKKVLICDYVSAMEKDYEPTMQSVRKAYGKDVEFEICAYENDKQLIQKLQGKDGLITGFLEIGEADQFKHFVDLVFIFFKYLTCLQTESDIFINGKPREKIVLLEHEASVRSRCRNRIAIQQDLASVGKG